jgi:tRNA(Ile)-lysidine synthase
MIILDRLDSFIKQHALFRPDERVLLAVSGGRDSVLMAHLFKAGGYSYAIAHCNFNLRGKESAGDEKFTSDLAEKLEVPFFSTTFDTQGYAEQHRISIQMAARDLRYSWLEQIRADSGYHYIALAHHANDVMETMLLNLTRGTGVAGLHGILPKKEKLIRPLLFLKRGEIDELIVQTGIAYREDTSNLSSKYARNLIRIEVIPLLKKLNPSLEETFEANRKRFSDLEVLLNERVNELKQQLFKRRKNEEYEISLTDIRKLKPLNTLLYELFHPYGFTEAVLHDLVSSWDGLPGKVFSSTSHNLSLDRDRLILTVKETTSPVSMKIEEEGMSFEWNRQSFRSDIISAENWQISKEKNIAQLDADLLQFPLTLRNWESGDYFYPIGMKGKKKLSDFFIEQKIPLPHKHGIGVLQNNDGNIVWVAGFRINDRYKVTIGTKKVFILEQFS